MIRLVFPSPLLSAIREGMAGSPVETCAVLFTYPAAKDRILVHEGSIVPVSAYRLRTEIAAELTPEYLFEVVRRARQLKAGIVLAHSHPASAGQPCFSDVDDAGEKAMLDYLELRLPDHAHIAMVVGPEGMSARRIGSAEAIRIEEVGSSLRVCFDPSGENESDHSAIHDRQVRAFGAAGQRLISRMKVGIVGLGGTGSVVAQELAHLGVGHFVLIDPDTLDTTNRNRVVGSEEGDLEKDKVAIASRLVGRINKDILVDVVKDTVIKTAICALLADCQFLFLCTDSHSSRAMVLKLCYQYMIPGIDVGVSISVADDTIKYVAGRTQMIAPGLPCLLCTGSIDPNAIRQELMSPEHRAADPYFNGDGEPQPAVISLNATMSSLAVTMFLAAVAGVPMNARYQRYDGIAGTVRPVAANAQDDCLVCSKAGALGRGQTKPLTL